MSTILEAAGVILGPILNALDASYAMTQGALKSLELVSPEGGPPPEEVTSAGRFAVLDAREGQWPELRVRLPETAVYQHTVESLLRRATIWRVPAADEDLLDWCRAAAREAWPEVREKAKGRVRVWVSAGASDGEDVKSTIRLTAAADGAAFLGIGQQRTLF